MPKPVATNSFQSNAADTSTIWSQPASGSRWNTTETGHSLRRAGTSPAPSRMNGTADHSSDASNANQSRFAAGSDAPFLGRARNSLTSLSLAPTFRPETRSNDISEASIMRQFNTMSLSQEPDTYESPSSAASRNGSVASIGVSSGPAGLPNTTAASPSSQRLPYATAAAPFTQRAHLHSATATAFSSPGAGASAVPSHFPGSLADSQTLPSTGLPTQGNLGGFFEGGLYGYGLPQAPGSGPSQLNPVSAAWNSVKPQSSEPGSWAPKRHMTGVAQPQGQAVNDSYGFAQDSGYPQSNYLAQQQQAQGGYNANMTAALLNRGQPAQFAQPARFEIPGDISGYLHGDVDTQSIALRAAFSQSRQAGPNSFGAFSPASFMAAGRPAIAPQYIQEQLLNNQNMFVPGVVPTQHPGLQFGQFNSPTASASAAGSLRDRDPSRSMRSHLLKEYLDSKGNRNFELLDIVGHVVEFSGDQHGSRFIQNKLESANKDTKDIIFGDLANNIIPLSMDVFGNYVIQKFLDHGSQKQKEYIAKQMKGRMVDLSTQSYSCRVVQRVMQNALLDQKLELAKELDGHVLRVAKDSNGCHVVLRILSDIDRSHLDFLVDAFRGKIVDLSAHNFGCRVVQNLYADGLDSDRAMIVSEIKDHIQELSMSNFGNYVVQKIIKGQNPAHKAMMLDAVISKLIPLCKQKQASNVVETCFIAGTYADRHRILREIIKADKPDVSIFYQLMNDQYGNYVLRKLLETLEGEDKILLAKYLSVQINLCKNSGPLTPKSGIERIAAALEELKINVDLSQMVLPSATAATSPASASSKLSLNNSGSTNGADATPPLTETPNSPDTSNPPSVHLGPPEADVSKSGEKLSAGPAIAQPADE